MTAPRILLVGDRASTPACLSERLTYWGAQCRFASSRAEVFALAQTERFDVVLSRIRLRDGNALHLIPLFEGQPTSLFSYLSAKDGCWWLPLLKSGSESERGPALQHKEFLKLLQQTVEASSGDSFQLEACGAESL